MTLSKMNFQLNLSQKKIEVCDKEISETGNKETSPKDLAKYFKRKPLKYGKK